MAADLVGLSRNAAIETLADDGRGRLGLAAAIAAGAGVMLLDQPFEGLDVPARDRICEWLVAAGQRGTTIIVADDENMTGLCNRTVVLCDGRIVESPSKSPVVRAVSSRELVGA